MARALFSSANTVNSSNLRCLTWTNMSPHANHLEANGLLVVFDTGSMYTYLTTLASINLNSLRICRFSLQVDRGFQGEFVRASDDTTLPHCWKLNGQQHVVEIVAYAKMILWPISFGFSQGKFYVIPPVDPRYQAA